MNKLLMLLFNNRKALGLIVYEKMEQHYSFLNHVVSIESMINCYDKGITYHINDGFIVGME